MFYHIYPLALCGAPECNDFSLAPVARLEALYPWIDHLTTLNLNALYLGPVFESTAHGYDTTDYYTIDRRLGTNDTFKQLTHSIKRRGLHLVLDGVFNHVGRDFPAFRDVIAHGQNSRYTDWFHLDFSRQSSTGDPFFYQGWAGHYDLVKLNLSHPDVRAHLFDAVSMWVREFDIDGLRLDAADHLDPDFMRALSAHCRSLKADFWLMGEVVHGDYNQWANPDMLDSTTNYEAYKGLYSSHVDCNYFEIAYSLNRQFGSDGLYRNLLLYSFADNHDVNRVASSLTNQAHLYPLYILLFTMPGIPSVYYGSEWGINGIRDTYSDKALRPCLSLDNTHAFPHPQLADTIRKLAVLRQLLPPLQSGDYQQLYVASQQFAFARSTQNKTVIVAVNAADQAMPITLNSLSHGLQLVDQLNGSTFPIHNGQAQVMLDPNWGRVLVAE
jgi:glycosidase